MYSKLNQYSIKKIPKNTKLTPYPQFVNIQLELKQVL